MASTDSAAGSMTSSASALSATEANIIDTATASNTNKANGVDSVVLPAIGALGAAVLSLAAML